MAAQASAQALAALPQLRPPSKSSIAQRRSLQPLSAAAAFAPAPVRLDLLRPRLQSTAAAPLSDSELDDEEEQDELEDAVGGRYGISSTERDGAQLSTDDMEFALTRHGISAPFAPGFLQKALKAAGRGSLFELYKEICKQSTWDKQKHSKAEVQTLAQTIDAVLAGDGPLALDIITRRLAAVQTGVETGNWEIGQTWMMDNQRTSFVPESHLIRGIKTTARQRIVERGSDAGYYPSSSRGARTTKTTSGGTRGGGGSSSMDRQERKRSPAHGDHPSSSSKKGGSTKK